LSPLGAEITDLLAWRRKRRQKKQKKLLRFLGAAASK
jgi:hypothetical protein